MSTVSSDLLAAMRDKAYRTGVVAAQIEIDIPFQLKALRKQRGWTQPELAVKADMKQPRISAMEKPGGANFTLETLKRLAEALDVALIVHFAPFSELLGWSSKFNPDTFTVPSFDDESLSDIPEYGGESQDLNVFVKRHWTAFHHEAAKSTKPPALQIIHGGAEPPVTTFKRMPPPVFECVLPAKPPQQETFTSYSSTDRECHVR